MLKILDVGRFKKLEDLPKGMYYEVKKTEEAKRRRGEIAIHGREDTGDKT